MTFLEKKTASLIKVGHKQLSEGIFALVKGEYVRIVELDIIDETYAQVMLSEDEVLALAELVKQTREKRSANTGI